MKTMLSFLLILSSWAMAAGLDDARLTKLMAQHQSGLIYVWSPRMPLSVQGRSEARQAATNLGVKFIEAQDPFSGSIVPGTTVMRSEMLMELGVLNHFPTVAFFHHGKLRSTLLPGFERREQLVNVARDVFRSDRVIEANKRQNDVIQLPLSELRSYANARVPEYFFKVRTHGEAISYSSGGRNYLFDLGDGTELLLPGPYDPVFNMGTDTMLFPISSTYHFYSLKQWRAGVTTPLLIDETLSGVYQSTGLLEKTEEKVTFRVISEVHSGHLSRDYEYSPANDTITPLGDSAKVICSNFRIKLPILSKNGAEVGGVDLTTRKTAVFKLLPDGTCEKVEELGIITGKLNFSYDSRFIAYHIYATDHTDYENRPDSNHQANIYVFDRQTKKTYQITTNIGLNSMYPDFTIEGVLVFADYPHSGEGSKYRFLDFKLPPTFSDVSQRVFVPHCIRCHSAARPQAGVNLDSYAGVMEHVVAGDPEQSLIYEVVKGSGFVRMPPGPPLPQSEIEYIRQWISSGARRE